SLRSFCSESRKLACNSIASVRPDSCDRFDNPRTVETGWFMSNPDRDKWNAKYAAAPAPREPSAVFLSLEKHLPRTGRAIDIAGGGGRHGIWLAQRGLDVTVADISPVGLAIAQQRAMEAGLSIQMLEIDLE